MIQQLPIYLRTEVECCLHPDRTLQPTLAGSLGCQVLTHLVTATQLDTRRTKYNRSDNQSANQSIKQQNILLFITLMNIIIKEVYNITYNKKGILYLCQSINQITNQLSGPNNRLINV